jgi:hypothetical protein
MVVNILQRFKKNKRCNMEIPEKLLPKISLIGRCKNKYLIELGEYEIVIENGKTYAIRKQ